MGNTPSILLNKQVIWMGVKKVHEVPVRTVDHEIEAQRFQQDFFS